MDGANKEILDENRLKMLGLPELLRQLDWF